MTSFNNFIIPVHYLAFLAYFKENSAKNFYLAQAQLLLLLLLLLFIYLLVMGCLLY